MASDRCERTAARANDNHDRRQAHHDHDQGRLDRSRDVMNAAAAATVEAIVRRRGVAGEENERDETEVADVSRRRDLDVRAARGAVAEERATRSAGDATGDCDDRRRRRRRRPHLGRQSASLSDPRKERIRADCDQTQSV